MTATPEHVLWAVERACPFRDSNNWTDPEQTARELRTLRAYSEALAEGRVLYGICLDRPTADLSGSPLLAFPASEVFSTFGEQEFLEKTCVNCAANVADRSSRLAGCHGWFEVTELKASVEKAYECLQSRGMVGDDALFDAPFVAPGFYGLWIESPWQGARISQAIKLFEEAASDANFRDEQFLGFVAALRRAKQHSLAIHVKLMPRGIVKGKYWHVVEHCPNCRAEWVSQTRQCQVCDFRGHAAPARKRHARGTRPFIPLERVIGAESAAELSNQQLTVGSFSCDRSGKTPQ